MTVFVKGIHGWKVLEVLLGGNPAIAALKSKGMEVKATASDLKIMQGAQVITSIPAELWVLKALSKGKTMVLPTGILGALQLSAQTALKQAISEAPIGNSSSASPQLTGSPVMTFPKPKQPSSKSRAKALRGGVKPAKPIGSSVTETVLSVAGVEMFDIAALNSGEKVPLAHATKLYQPVKGTGGSSRYFAVAIGPDVRVAARYKNDKLSIRAEGPGLAKYVNQFQAIGMSGNKDTHFSMHLGPFHNEQLAAKTLGAVLLGLGIPFATPVPDLDVIKGKGS